MIGLIIALTVISESAVLVDSYRQEIFEEMIFTEDSPYYGDIRAEIYVHEGFLEFPVPSESNFPELITNFTRISSILDQASSLYSYEDHIKKVYFHGSQYMGYWSSYHGEWEPLGIQTYFTDSEEFFTGITPYLQGRLPVNSSEVILIRPEGDPSGDEWDIERERRFENFSLASEVNISLFQDFGYPYNSKPYISRNISIVGVLNYPRPSYRGGYYTGYSESIIENSTLGLLYTYLEAYRYWNDYYLLTKPILLKGLLEELSSGDNEIYWDNRINGKIFLDQSQMDGYNVPQEMNKLKNYIQGLEESFSSAGYSTSIYSNILYMMEIYQTQIFMLTVLLILVSFPVICIALYLVIYSFGLIRRQKQEQIGILKTRGGSWVQVFVILLGEIIISTVVAVFVGFVISLILADLVMRSKDYLTFIGAPVPVIATLDLLQNLVVWGLIIALFLNLLRIWRMSRQKITETVIPTEKRPPIWKRYYLDVIMFVIGTVTWIILVEITRTPISDDFGQAYYLIIQIIAILGIPAPFFMFFGSIMVIARFFPYLMKMLSDFLWKIEGGVNAFAIRNVVRHKQAANRAVLLLTLALAFSILASSLIFSIDETEKLNAYYRHGADIVVPSGTFANETVDLILRENITSIKQVSHLYQVSFYAGGIASREYQFLFVDPETYAQVAFEDPSFQLSHSMSNLMNKISDNKSIVLFEGNMEADVNKPSIGENISLLFQGVDYTELRSFKIGGTFKYWPSLYPYEWYDPSRNYWIIGSKGLFESLNSSFVSYSINSRYLLKIMSANQLDQIVEDIFNQTNIEPISPALEFKSYKDSFSRSFMLSVLNSDLIICATVAIVGVIMFAFFTYVERGKEIGVERALGMTRLQTAQTFLIEALTILTFGIVIGLFAGAYFVTMILQILQFGESIPPVVVKYPFTLFGQLLLLILVFAGIGTVIPARLASKRDISRVLKVE
jgi:ABC-type lipoprotein release transport system permease subunit